MSKCSFMQLQETASPEESFLRLSETAVVHVQVLVDFTKRLPGKFFSFGKYYRIAWGFWFFLRGRNHNGMNRKKKTGFAKTLIQLNNVSTNSNNQGYHSLVMKTSQKHSFQKLAMIRFLFNFWHGAEASSESTWISKYHLQWITISTHLLKSSSLCNLS